MIRTDAPPTIPLEAPSEAPSRRVALALTVAAIWVAVSALSLFATDLVSGTEQEHVPIAAIGTWLWGGLATGLVLLAAGVGDRDARGVWGPVAGIVATIWAAVAVAGIFSPAIETGTDPTSVPIAAILAPVAGAIGTAFVSVYAAGASCRRSVIDVRR
jgi:hypothetical protein